MKRMLLYLLLCLPCSVMAQAPLTNADIIKLTKLELPSPAIISKIKNSPTHFDVSVDALVALKQQGVNGDVVTEMITANAQEHKEIANQKDYKDPKTMHKDGIYYYDQDDAANPLKVMDMIVASNLKSRGRMASAFTYGIVKGKYSSELPGAHSHRQIPHAKPAFYLYVNPPNTGSPNLFVLVRLTEKNTIREMHTGTISGGSSSMGIDEDAKVDFDYEQVADGIYKLYPKHPLETGEYCFLYTMSMPGISSAGAVYDFGISVGSDK